MYSWAYSFLRCYSTSKTISLHFELVCCFRNSSSWSRFPVNYPSSANWRGGKTSQNACFYCHLVQWFATTTPRLPLPSCPATKELQEMLCFPILRTSTSIELVWASLWWRKIRKKIPQGLLGCFLSRARSSARWKIYLSLIFLKTVPWRSRKAPLASKWTSIDDDFGLLCIIL